ncbi:sterol desaturase [Guillardia theta CCMP2712]|uniref:Sterol desaturase n=1 Tax=Guillardia theta (strain CCMP2712) TaxID=905079 RepID=L1JX35_GUITC|nr:sterol desaturase [Guillardia theta CCMP2712]EKX53146.1 sterol desaturase [Guillardia theta CCMP2712]|eukprot:XP_005840126.1 sterol desaturase [Guillardia theta CCMP2712]
MVGRAFLAGAAAIVVGYHGLSCALQAVYYLRRRCSPQEWKIQPQRFVRLQSPACWSPFLGRWFGRREGKEEYHDFVCAMNVITAGCSAGFVVRSIVRGSTRLLFDWKAAGRLPGVVGTFCLAVGWQSVLEYYWHRLMHLPFFYKHFHKMHHSYKSPQPFDDMYIHPVEAVGYYCILYSPPFVFPLHVYGFVLYMAIMGVCGILDHSGIKWGFLGIYNTEDHDKHHEHFDCNFAFPFVWMDILHGTFAGDHMGIHYPLSSAKLGMK